MRMKVARAGIAPALILSLSAGLEKPALYPLHGCSILPCFPCQFGREWAESNCRSSQR